MNVVHQPLDVLQLVFFDCFLIFLKMSLGHSNVEESEISCIGAMPLRVLTVTLIMALDYEDDFLYWLCGSTANGEAFDIGRETAAVMDFPVFSSAFGGFGPIVCQIDNLNQWLLVSLP